MPDWTPEAIQQWLFEKLYPAYMEDSQGAMWFDEQPDDSSAPPIRATIRESELMEAVGYVEIVGKSFNIIELRLTPQGRVYWETLQKEPPPDQSQRECLGFVP